MAVKAESELREELSGRLLEVIDPIRDPLWGDIEVTQMELDIIDTPEFQRLRGIKQLGPTKLVYPGASHDRFSHSLGTLWWSDRIVETCKKNAPVYGGESIGRYPHLLARTCALLHDLAHIPFGHTLEDEGSLWPAQWKDAARLDALLGSESAVVQKLKESLSPLGEAGASRVLKDIRQVLVAREESKDEPVLGKEDIGEVRIRELPYPYVADIVGNTICADLLDYVARDFFNAGILERYGDRFLRYFVIKNDPVEHALRLTIVVVGRDGKERPSIVREAVDLLRRRLSLAEKAYYHRTKIAASSMIISAVANSRYYRVDYGAPTEKPVMNPKGSVELLKLVDDELIALLRSPNRSVLVENGVSEQAILKRVGESRPHGNERCRYILDRWMDRRLYRPVYRTSYWPNRLVSLEHVERLIEQFSDPQNRLTTEGRLEETFGMPKGAAVVYCPSRRMGMKVYRARVLLKEGKMVTLEGNLEEGAGYPDEGVQEEIAAIKGRHLALWGLYVFLEPAEHERVNRVDVSDYCSELFGLPNDLDQDVLPGSRILRIVVRGYADRYTREFKEQRPPITVPELQVLESGLAGTYATGDKATGLTYEKFKEYVHNLRAGDGV